MKTMITPARVLSLLMFLMLSMTASAATAEARYTHGVFYPGMQRQPVLQLKITGEPGEKITAITFTAGSSSRPSDIRQVRLSSREDWNGYTFNTNKYIYENARARFSGTGSVTFRHQYELSHQPLYIWLSYDLANNARRNGKIDAVCTAIQTTSGTIEPEIVNAAGLEERRIGRVFPFPYHVVPYYRPRWVKGWGNAERAVHLTPTHFNLFTEIIHFAYSVSAAGDVTYQWAGGGMPDSQVADEALQEIKRLHREAQARSRLIAGFGHMDGPMTEAVANPNTRRRLARNMAHWAISRGYDGIDIDWEYPDSEDQWRNFGYFIADLREELAGSSLSISIAASVTYKVPTYWVTDQLDFLMTMSYDDLTPDNHASMRRFQGDANVCLNNFHMPKPRIVVGLPFYSNERGKLTQQYGYSQILGWHPRIRPNENEYVSRNQDGSNGPVHTFNGPTLITEKCRWIKQEGFGGVMIWAYDTDVPLTHRASLGRAMFRVIRQPRRN